MEMGENLEKYIVYLTVNIKNNKIYIGIHKTSNKGFDGYLGNGVYINKPSSYKFGRTPFEHAVSKYGVDSFKRVTIKEFDNLQDALNLEIELVNYEFIKRKDTYNITLGGGLPPIKEIGVHKYSLSGEYIESYKSIKDAAFKTTGNKSINISRAAKNPGAVQVGGFMWSYDKVEKLEIYKHYNKERKVGKYDLNGNLIKVYDTVRECKKEYPGCVHVLKGTRQKAGGFTFKYIN